MAAIVHSDKAKKAIKKIKEAMQDYPLGIEFGELMQKTGYAKSSLYSALSLVGAHKSDDGLWHLPGSQNVVAPVNETAEDDLDDNLDDLATAIDQPVKQDDGGNMQDNGGNTQDAPVNIEDEELNTEAPQVSSPDNESSYPDNEEATLINPSAEVVNPSAIDTNTDQQDTTEVGRIIASIDDLHPEFAQLPDYQSSNGQAIETTSLGLAAELKQLDNAYLDGLASKAEAPNSEVSQAMVNQKRFILIENCLLSLSRDEIGERPCLAKDCWFDSHGNDIPLESPDGQFLQKAVGGFCSDAIFRGEEYYRRYTLQSQLFHGVFDSLEDAEHRIAELMFIKPDKNHFEIIEV